MRVSYRREKNRQEEGRRRSREVEEGGGGGGGGGVCVCVTEIATGADSACVTREGSLRATVLCVV